MNLPELRKFSLVGGTALSLIYGHRVSVDLDLFCSEQFDNETIDKALREFFGKKYISEDKQARFGIFCYIDEVKVDLVRHPHPLIRPGISIEGIRMYALEDIIAMKVQAVLGRGKKKDFWDVAELLEHFTVADFVKFHKEKFSTQNLLISVPQALTYFADADESEEPISLKNQTWSGIKKIITTKVRKYLK